jgi:hypothetical protein
VRDEFHIVVRHQTCISTCSVAVFF